MRTNQWNPSTMVHFYEPNHSSQLHQVCKALQNGMYWWLTIESQYLKYLIKGWPEIRPVSWSASWCDMWGGMGVSETSSDQWPAQVVPKGHLVLEEHSSSPGRWLQACSWPQRWKECILMGSSIDSKSESLCPSGHSQVSYHTTNARRNLAFHLPLFGKDRTG